MRCPLGRKCSRPAVWILDPADDSVRPVDLCGTPVCEWHGQQLCDAHPGHLMTLV